MRASLSLVLVASLSGVNSSSRPAVGAIIKSSSALVVEQGIDEEICGTRSVSAVESIAVWTRLPSVHFTRGSINIDVHWHVLQDSAGNGGLARKQVDDSIDVLNAAFSSSSFVFTLKAVDYESNTAWFNMQRDPLPAGGTTSPERAAKRKLGIKDKSILNIYSGQPAGKNAAWATYAFDVARDLEMDGVVIHSKVLNGGSHKYWNLGISLAHEVGHWLGLLHTFENGCSPNGDEVNDTPYQRVSTTGCPMPSDSCNTGKLDPVHNYMDYSDDTCRYEFTNMQSASMNAMWQQHRQ